MSDSQVFMENGTVAHQPKMQMPLGNEILPKENTKFYICTVKHASFARIDGKQIVFKNCFLETRNKQDMEYLDKEIADENMFLRYATEEEIKQNFMDTNPRDFYKEALRPELELEIRAELEAKIRAELSGTSIPDDGKKYDQPSEMVAVAQRLKMTSTADLPAAVSSIKK